MFWHHLDTYNTISHFNINININIRTVSTPIPVFIMAGRQLKEAWRVD